MRKYILIIFAVLLVSSSCSRMRDIRITDYKIAELENVGFTGLKVSVRLTVDNPAKEFSVVSVSGSVKRDGSEFGVFVMDTTVTVPGEAVSECLFPLEIGLADSVSPFELLGLASSFNRSDMTVNAVVKVRLKSGIRRSIRLNDMGYDEIMSFVK